MGKCSRVQRDRDPQSQEETAPYDALHSNKLAGFYNLPYSSLVEMVDISICLVSFIFFCFCFWFCLCAFVFLDGLLQSTYPRKGGPVF